MRKDLVAGAAVGVVVAGCVAVRVAQNAFQKAVSQSNDEIYNTPFIEKTPQKYFAVEEFPLGIGA